MDRQEVERKISEGLSLLNEGKPEMAELWMTRLLAEKFDMSEVDKVLLGAQATDIMGRAQYALRRYKEALGTLQNNVQNLQDWLADRQYNSDSEERRKIGQLLTASLENLCFARMEQKQEAEAEIAAREAIEIAQQFGGENSMLLAQALFGVSLVWYRKKDFDTAEDMLLRAQKIFEANSDLKMVAFCYNNLGRIYEEQGKIQKGIEFHTKAVELRRVLPDKLALAFSLGNLGAALASNSEWQKAKEALSEAVALYENANLANLPEYAGFKNNLEICEKALEEQKSDKGRTSSGNY